MTNPIPFVDRLREARRATFTRIGQAAEELQALRAEVVALLGRLEPQHEQWGKVLAHVEGGPRRTSVENRERLRQMVQWSTEARKVLRGCLKEIDTALESIADLERKRAAAEAAIAAHLPQLQSSTKGLISKIGPVLDAGKS